MKTHRHTHTHSHFWSLSSIQSWKLILRHVLGHHYHKATTLTQTHWRKTTEKNKRAICTLVVVVPSREVESQQHCLVKFLAAAAVEWWQIQDIFHFLFLPSLPLLWGPKCPPQPQASYFKFEFFLFCILPSFSLFFFFTIHFFVCVCALAINLPLRPQLWFLVHYAYSAGRFVFECRSFLPSFFLFHILIFILFFKAAKRPSHTHAHKTSSVCTLILWPLFFPFFGTGHQLCRRCSFTHTKHPNSLFLCCPSNSNSSRLLTAR